MQQYRRAEPFSKDWRAEKRLAALRKLRLTQSELIRSCRESADEFAEPTGRDTEKIQMRTRMRRTKPDHSEHIVLPDAAALQKARMGSLPALCTADLAADLLSYIDGTQSEDVRRMQVQAITSAGASSSRLGNSTPRLPAGFTESYNDWKAGRCTLEDACGALRISPDTFCYYMRCVEGR